MSEDKRKPCVFCGLKRKKTKQHVFNKWMKQQEPPAVQAIPAVQRKHDQYVSRSFMGADGQPQGQGFLDAEKNGSVNQRHVPVCFICNNRGLQGIETAADPLLRRILAKESFTMSVDDQVKIAAWGATVAMTGEFTQKDPQIVIAQAEREETLATKLPPAKNWGIWIWTASDHAWDRRYFSRWVKGMVRETGQPIFLRNTTIGVGLMVVHIRNGTLDASVDEIGGVSEAGVRIWPAPTTPVNWPLQPAVPYVKTEVLAQEMLTNLTNVFEMMPRLSPDTPLW
jgi:hypothetical protein